MAGCDVVNGILCYRQIGGTGSIEKPLGGDWRYRPRPVETLSSAPILHSERPDRHEVTDDMRGANRLVFNANVNPIGDWHGGCDDSVARNTTTIITPWRLV